MTIALPNQKIKLSDNTVRRSLMVLLAFVMTHLITYQKVAILTGLSIPVYSFYNLPDLRIVYLRNQHLELSSAFRQV
jgi:hypothetical protein